jgi:uncharacterized protein
LTARVPFCPGRRPVDAWGHGRFAFAGMQHDGAILCLPSGIMAWSVADFQDLTEDAFAPVLAEARDIDFLCIGTGETFRPLPQPLMWRLRDVNLRLEVTATGPAVRTYNVLVAEARRAAAALLPVY